MLQKCESVVITIVSNWFFIIFPHQNPKIHGKKTCVDCAARCIDMDGMGR